MRKPEVDVTQYGVTTTLRTFRPDEAAKFRIQVSWRRYREESFSLSFDGENAHFSISLPTQEIDDLIVALARARDGQQLPEEEEEAKS